MSEKAERMYETSGEIDEATYLTLVLRNLWKPGQLNRIYVLCAVLFAMSLYLLYRGDEEAAQMFVLILVLTALFVWMPFQIRKNASKHFNEAAPGGKLAYTTSFADDKMCLVNHTNGGSGELQLSQVKKVFSVDGVWALLSKGGMFYLVFAEQLHETDRESLLALLKQNNPKIKIQLPKKR